MNDIESYGLKIGRRTFVISGNRVYLMAVDKTVDVLIIIAVFINQAANVRNNLLDAGYQCERQKNTKQHGTHLLLF